MCTRTVCTLQSVVEGQQREVQGTHTMCCCQKWRAEQHYYLSWWRVAPHFPRCYLSCCPRSTTCARCVELNNTHANVQFYSTKQLYTRDCVIHETRLHSVTSRTPLLVLLLSNNRTPLYSTCTFEGTSQPHLFRTPHKTYSIVTILAGFTLRDFFVLQQNNMLKAGYLS